MVTSRKFARDLADSIYGQAPSRKLNRKIYQRDIDMTHRCGEMLTCETIINNHRKDPYPDIETLIGDLQIALKDAHDDCRTRLKVNLRPVQMETLIAQSGY